MAILQSCCCWRSVRRGSYASALYTMGYFVVTMLVVGCVLHDEQVFLVTNNSTRSAGTTASLLQPDRVTEVNLAFYVAVLACSACGVISTLLLLLGLSLDNRLLLIPWMLSVTLTALVDLAHIMYTIIFDKTHFKPEIAMLFTVDFFLISLNMYSLLCVVSQYQEYKAGRGRASDDDNALRFPPVRYVSQPTATSMLSTRRGTHTTVHEAHSPTADGTTVGDREAADMDVLAGPRLTVPPPPYSRRPGSVRKHVQFPDQSCSKVVVDEDSSLADSPGAVGCGSLEDRVCALQSEWPTPDEHQLLVPINTIQSSQMI